MSCKRLQFNPSTLKTMYNNVTGKVMMVDVCASDCACFAATEWDSSTAYSAGDTVLHGTNYYNCISGHTGQEPPNATYWYDMESFGGPSATQKTFTAVFSGITHCDCAAAWPGDPNITITLNHSSGCTWSGQNGAWYARLSVGPVTWCLEEWYEGMVNLYGAFCFYDSNSCLAHRIVNSLLDEGNYPGPPLIPHCCQNPPGGCTHFCDRRPIGTL